MLKSASNSPVKASNISASTDTTPTRRPGSSSVMTNSVAARERYLYAVILLGENANSDDLWHVMTSAPANFSALHDDLKANLNSHRDIIIAVSKAQKQGLDPLITRLFNVMLGDGGIYCYITRKSDPNRMVEYTPHVAQAIIFEEKRGAVINGISHREKGSQMLVAIKSVIEKLNILRLDISKLKPGLPLLVAKLDSFIQYYSLHKKCFELALTYKNDAQRLDTSCTPNSLSDFVLDWHPHSMQQITPLRITLQTEDFRTHHLGRMAKVFSRSSSILTTSITATSSSVVQSLSAKRLQQTPDSPTNITRAVTPPMRLLSGKKLNFDSPVRAVDHTPTRALTTQFANILTTVPSFLPVDPDQPPQLSSHGNSFGM